jgi:two-component system osmolarity sensor histidine kinase EnvZ
MTLRTSLCRPFNSLFGRMALISVTVLVVVQAGWFTLLAIERPLHDADGYARGLLLVIEAANSDATLGGRLARAMRVHLVPVWNMPASVELRDPAKTPLAPLARQLAGDLPPGTQLAVDGNEERQPRLWVRYPKSSNWIVTPIDLPPAPPFMMESIAMLIGAVVLSLFATWQLQRPLTRVAQAARRFGAGERPVPVGEKGPRELRDLIGAFNQMMRTISDADDDKAVMLAGIAHDLKAPLTRLKLRTSMLVDDDAERSHFMRDIDSLTRIVQQFLEFAARSPSHGPEVGVDAFLAEQFSLPEDSDAPLFALSLEAGDAFRLPRTFIDRLMTNLVDNALEHGEPPVEIRTARHAGEWIVEVRDHGPGIPADRIEEALKPFVRLDPARSGDGHCGLGLAIVGRLAGEHGGRCEVRNAAGGGLLVRIAMPAAARHETRVAEIA